MATAPPLVGKLVYRFEEGDATQGELLGGKGSNLCEMAHLGLPAWQGGSEAPVPPIGHRLGRLDMILYSYLQLSKGRALELIEPTGLYQHF